MNYCGQGERKALTVSGPLPISYVLSMEQKKQPPC
jgi:hypothetical protein